MFGFKRRRAKRAAATPTVEVLPKDAEVVEELYLRPSNDGHILWLQVYYDGPTTWKWFGTMMVEEELPNKKKGS